jgi:hypothetical protein
MLDTIWHTSVSLSWLDDTGNAALAELSALLAAQGKGWVEKLVCGAES